MNLLITICARGGSKGIPDKNIKELNGTPLIGYSIKTAFDFANQFTKGSVDVVLSTDSPEIQKVAASFGLISNYKRPDRLATDEIGKLDVIKDIWRHQEGETNRQYQYLIDMDVTSPLRNLMDLNSGFEKMESDASSLNLFSVSPAHRNPYFNMVELATDGYARLVKKPENNILARQAAPQVFDMNASFYIFKRTFLEQDHRTVITNRSIAHKLPHICFDLDTPLDFEFMAYLIQRDKLDFEF